MIKLVLDSGIERNEKKRPLEPRSLQYVCHMCSSRQLLFLCRTRKSTSQDHKTRSRLPKSLGHFCLDGRFGRAGDEKRSLCMQRKARQRNAGKDACPNSSSSRRRTDWHISLNRSESGTRSKRIKISHVDQWTLNDGEIRPHFRDCVVLQQHQASASPKHRHSRQRPTPGSV